MGLQQIDKACTSAIINVLVKMENKGKSPYTIETTSKALRKLAKNADLNNTEAVERYIARLETTDAYKAILCTAYQRYCNYYAIEWEKPTYKGASKQIKVPTKEKLQTIIAASGKQMALKLNIIYEAGLRPVEVVSLTPEHIDFDNKTITPSTAKHGLPRTLPISTNLRDALQAYINEKQIQPKEKLFPITPRTYSKLYRITRNKVADRTGDQTLKMIRLYDFRHYFGTITYDKTKDLAFTAEQLGHRNWSNTQIYVHILRRINMASEEYTCKVAKTPEDVCQLIEAGFQYVTELDGLKFFKKRK